MNLFGEVMIVSSKMYWGVALTVISVFTVIGFFNPIASKANKGILICPNETGLVFFKKLNENGGSYSSLFVTNTVMA
jgi:hypothetical protein